MRLVVVERGLSMIGEWVRGWCLVWNDQQIPDLMECDVQRTGTPTFFTQAGEDRYYATPHYLGETFFFHKLPALNMLVYRLEEAERGHQEALAYIEQQKIAAWEEFKQERANGGD